MKSKGVRLVCLIMQDESELRPKIPRFTANERAQNPATINNSLWQSWLSRDDLIRGMRNWTVFFLI